MSSPYKASFKTANKRPIRSQFILQENKKRNQNSNIKSKENISFPTQIILKNRGRSLTPEPTKKIQVFNENSLTPKKSNYNPKNLCIRSVTPTPKYLNFLFINTSIRQINKNKRSRKIENSGKIEDNHSKKVYYSN